MRSAISFLVNFIKAEQKYTQKTWEYLKKAGLRPDPIRESIEQESIDKYKALSIYISPRQQCELIEHMLKFANAKYCLEVGVFTGTSALSIARGIGPDGKLVALELSEEYIKVAEKHWKSAGVADRIEVRIGSAVKTLQNLIAEGNSGKFDFAYIDADKTGYLKYYELALQLVRKGGILAFDNVLLMNTVADQDINGENVKALRELNEKIVNDPRVQNFILPIGDGVNIVSKN